LFNGGSDERSKEVALKSVQTMLPLQSHGTGIGKTNGYVLDTFVPEHSQVFVHVTAIGGGTLDIKIQDSWKDIDANYSNTGDEALGINANGITRVPPDAVRGKYIRVWYEVKTAAVTFAIYLDKKEMQ